jgi:flagellar hook-basal body complex protein FliE
MTVNLGAINAYRNQLKMQDKLQGAGGLEDGMEKPSFFNMVEEAAQKSIDTQYQSEGLKMDALSGAGKVELSDLVTAVANADLTLSTVVAIRDRVVGAYQEIMRMPI